MGAYQNLDVARSQVGKNLFSLLSLYDARKHRTVSRAPQGARGLKLCGQADRTGSRGVAPRKGRVG